jgi:hypothetical protein
LPLISGNPRGEAPALTDAILQRLSDGGSWTRTELQVALGGRVKSEALTQALETLEALYGIRV